MFKGFYNLTSGMLTQGRKLDVVSNNMSNVATTGFKQDRFTNSTFDQVMWSRVGNKHKEYVDIGEQSYITAPSQMYTDFSQASFDDTGMPLDFAIEGEGYFAVETDNGRIYTRAGDFMLDDEGYLCIPRRGRVLDVNGNEMLIVTDRIESDGYGGIFTEDGAFLGRLGVYAFEDDEAALEKNEYGQFVTDVEPQLVQPRILHGMLDRSNVDLVQQMVDMIASQRLYQNCAQASQLYNGMMSHITADIGRLG